MSKENFGYCVLLVFVHIIASLNAICGVISATMIWDHNMLLSTCVMISSLFVLLYITCSVCILIIGKNTMGIKITDYFETYYNTLDEMAKK